MLNRLQTGQSRNRVLNPGVEGGGDGQYVFLFFNSQDKALGPTEPRIQQVAAGFVSEAKRPGNEADHLHPPIAEVKNGWSCTCTAAHSFFACTMTTLPSWEIKGFCVGIEEQTMRF